MKTLKRFVQENEYIMIAAWGIIFAVTGFISLFWRIDWLFEALTVVTVVFSGLWLIGAIVATIRDHMELNAE